MDTATKYIILLATEPSWSVTLPSISPTIGPTELLTNAALDAPYTAGLANGWSQFGSPTLAEETTIVRTPAGSSQKLTVTATSKAVYQSPVLTLGVWYYLSGYLYVSAGAAHMVRSDVKLGLLTSASATAAAWTQVVGAARCIAAGSAGPWFQSPGGAATFYVDDASMKVLTLATLFTLRACQQVNGVFTNHPSRTLATQAGIVHYANATNQVIAYLDGAGNVQVDKNVAGTWSSVSTTAVVYAAGAALTMQRAGYGAAATYTVTYNGSAVGSANSITDTVFDTAHQWGNFSTYAPNTFGLASWTGPH